MNQYSDLYSIVEVNGKFVLEKYIGDLSTTDLIIPNYVNRIGPKAFENCSSISSITLPTSLETIGDKAFYFCKSLKEIQIPNTVTEIGSYAFCCCYSLTSVTLSASIRSLDFVFVGCSSLSSITLPSSIERIGGAFQGCSCLTSITLPNSINDISSAFNSCSSLTEITIPQSVKYIDCYTFEGCKALRKVVISNSVEEIHRNAFSECISLEEVIVPGSVKEIEVGTFARVGKTVRVFRSLEISGVQPHLVDESRYRHVVSSYLITYPDPKNSEKYMEVPCPLSLSIHGSSMKDLMKYLDNQFFKEDTEIKPLIAFFRIRSNYDLKYKNRQAYLAYTKSRVHIVARDIVQREGVESLSLLLELGILNKSNISRLFNKLVDESDVETRTKLINYKYTFQGFSSSNKLEL